MKPMRASRFALALVMEVSATCSTGQPMPPQKPSPKVVGGISGVVTEHGSGKPIIRAMVLVLDVQQLVTSPGIPQPAQELPLPLYTDSTGHYATGPLLPGTYTVRILMIGYTAVTSQVVVRDSTGASLDAELRLDKIKIE